MARILRDDGLILASGYQKQRWELAKEPNSAFVRNPTSPNQVGLLDFSEFSDHVGAGLGVSPGVGTGSPKVRTPPFARLTECEPIRRIFNAIELALADHSAVSGYRLLEAVAPDTGELGPAGRIVTDNGGPFRSLNFELFIMQHPELRHGHARMKSPCQNGSRERDPGER